LGVLIVASLPIVGWALLLGLAGAVAFPGVAVTVVAGLVVWGWAAGKQREARLRREHAANEARLARIKEPHGGKDRYFTREGDVIKLMSFYRGGYSWVASYRLDWMARWRESAGGHDMLNDPKRLTHWQAVFDEWIETGVKPPQETWWMFPDELAQHEEREAKYQQSLKIAVCPETSLTRG
jgi:hypothetical protein